MTIDIIKTVKTSRLLLHPGQYPVSREGDIITQPDMNQFSGERIDVVLWSVCLTISFCFVSLYMTNLLCKKTFILQNLVLITHLLISKHYRDVIVIAKQSTTAS